MTSILLTNTAYRPCIGGIENSLHYIAKSYEKLGVQTLVACSDQTPTGVGRLPASEVIDGIEVRRYPNLGRWTNALGLAPSGTLLQALRFLRGLAKEQHFDGIIARQQSVGLAAKLAFPDVPVVYAVSSMAAQLNREDLRTPFEGRSKEFAYSRLNRHLLLPQQDWMQRACLGRADVVLVFSENMRRQVLDRVPSASERIFVHPPGVDTERFAPGADKPSLRRALALPEAGLLGVAVGRLIRAKGFDRAIDAVALAGDEARDVHLAIVGGGAERDALERRARDAGVADRIHFAGATDRPERYYAAADFYVMSSRYESFGQSIIEAMSAGLPVLAYRSSGDARVLTASDELIEDGRDGLLCHIDGGGLAAGLMQLRERSAEERGEMGKAGMAKVANHYSWRAFAEFALERIRAAG
jgi:glycosyltransferase involved in cell wall biosynthesis